MDCKHVFDQFFACLPCRGAWRITNNQVSPLGKGKTHPHYPPCPECSGEVVSFHLCYVCSQAFYSETGGRAEHWDRLRVGRAQEPQVPGADV